MNRNQFVLCALLGLAMSHTCILASEVSTEQLGYATRQVILCESVTFCHPLTESQVIPVTCLRARFVRGSRLSVVLFESVSVCDSASESESESEWLEFAWVFAWVFAIAIAWALLALCLPPMLPMADLVMDTPSISARSRSCRGFLRLPSAAIGNLSASNFHTDSISPWMRKIRLGSAGSPSLCHDASSNLS